MKLKKYFFFVFIFLMPPQFLTAINPQMSNVGIKCDGRQSPSKLRKINLDTYLLNLNKLRTLLCGAFRPKDFVGASNIPIQF